ncbi:MAG: type IX secretion system membrane protein PorP/SprF [Saprospiraceae bacterium]|nr:type IX secretion system membrane protein PorP/SprF [Saprospiraceae bacterium]
MKKIVLLLLISTAALQLSAQQEQHFTQFMHNKLQINPAYSGSRGIPFVTALYRNQWMGFDGAPKSFLASFNSPFITPRVGIGVTLSHFQVGLNTDFSGSLAYSYDLIGREDLSVRAGIMGSIRSLSIDFAKAQPFTVVGDQSLGSIQENSIYGNVGAGIYATIAQQFYVGFSVPRIVSSTIGIYNDQALTIAKDYQHFYVMAGAILPLTDDINLMPALLAKYVKNAPFDMDVNVNLEIKEKITAGLSYRVGGDGPGESMDLLVFWKAHPQFGVGIAYDFTLSNVKDYTAGSIELLLQADLKRSSKNKKMSNPRFFM